MGRAVIVAYRPKPGRDGDLMAAVRKHLEVLRQENLVTDRPAHVMRAADGTLLEVFDWHSAEVISQAHSNPAVQALWRDFGEACEYVPLAHSPKQPSSSPSSSRKVSERRATLWCGGHR